MDSSRLPRLHPEAISSTRSVVVWALKCDETVIISEVRLGLTAHGDRTSS